jgi:thiol-disulfide isomerase/thioredoxin
MAQSLPLLPPLPLPGLRTVLVGAALCAASLCQGSMAASTALSLELPTLDGTAFVRLDDYAGKPVLLNFWGSDCPPCVKELPLLFAQAPRHAGMPFLGIAVDRRSAASRFLAQRQPSYPQLLATAQPEVLLRRFGNKTGALPFTVVVDVRRRVCASHQGEVNTAWIAAAAQACGASPTR